MYPFFVLPFSFSVNGTEGALKEAVKCAPLVLPGDTIVDPRRFPSSLNKSSSSVLLLIFSSPATVKMTRAVSPAKRKNETKTKYGSCFSKRLIF